VVNQHLHHFEKISSLRLIQNDSAQCESLSVD
jgi:hypothetical protein